MPPEPTARTGLTRLGVIGDVHAEHSFLAAALGFLHALEEPVDAIVCTGDVADGAGSVDACCDILARHEVLTVRGNHDRWLLEERVRHVPNAHHRRELSRTAIDYLESLPVVVDIDTVAGRLQLCHGVGGNDLAKVWPGSERMPPERSRRLDRMIDAGEYRYLLNGHMHYRTVISFAGMTLVNAGTLRRDHRPGFSVIDFARGSIHAYAVGREGVEQLLTTQLDQHAGRRVWEDTRAFDGDWTPLVLY